MSCRDKCINFDVSIFPQSDHCYSEKNITLTFSKVSVRVFILLKIHLGRKISPGVTYRCHIDKSITTKKARKNMSEIDDYKHSFGIAHQTGIRGTIQY